MAYRRSITDRASLVARRFHPSFSYILQQKSFGSSVDISAVFNAFLKKRSCSLAPRTGSSFCRYMSTTIGDGSEKIEYINDVAEVLADTTVETLASLAPAVSEVAIAAADSFYPVAALQYLIDGVHNLTGFNW